MLAHFRNVADPFGWFAAVLEWGFLWLLAAQNGRVSGEAIRAQYDGSLFYAIEESRRSSTRKTRRGGGTMQKEQQSSFPASPSVSGYPPSPLSGAKPKSSSQPSPSSPSMIIPESPESAHFKNN